MIKVPTRVFLIMLRITLKIRIVLLQLIAKLLISLVLSKDVTEVSDNIVKVNGLSIAQRKYVQLNRGQIPKFDSKGITFGHHNIRSLIGKIDEFRHMCTNIFDVICVNETLCDETVDDNELTLPGYNFLRCDRNRNSGGVALYIKDVFNFTRRDDLWCGQNC